MKLRLSGSAFGNKPGAVAFCPLHPRAILPLLTILSLVPVSPAFAQTVPRQSAGSVSTVSRQQVIDSPDQNVEEVVGSVPNVNQLGYSAQSQPPASNSISMRGLGGGTREGGISRALVTMDGMPLNDPFFGYIQWSRAPLDDIDHIQIARGGQSMLRGNYAEGGVIDIVTLAQTQNNIALNGGGGSYGTYRGSISGAYRANDDNLLQAFIEANGTSGYQQIHLPGFPFIVPATSSAVNVHLKDSVTFASDLTAHLSLFYHNDRQRFETPLDRSTQQNLTVSADVTKQFSGSQLLALTFFYGDGIFKSPNSTYSLDSFPPVAPLGFSPPPPTEYLNEIHHVRTHDAGASLVWSQHAPDVLDWRMGVDWHYISGDDHTDHLFLPSHLRGLAETRGGGDQLFAAGFAQVAISPLQGLDVVGGGRIQYLRNLNGYDGSFGGLGEIPSRAYAYFEPRVDARYALPAGFALRGAYYQSYRAPNLADQFYAHAAGLNAELPNPMLKPEKLEGGEAGLDFEQSGFRAQITLYRTEIGNYVVIGRAANAAYAPHGWVITQNQNAASMQAQGIEAEAGWDIGAGFSAHLAYTLADSVLKRNPLDPVTVGRQLLDVPLQTAAAELAYAYAQGARISIEARYTSKTRWFALVANDSDNLRSLAKSNLAINLFGSYPIDRDIDLYASVQNLFNQRYTASGYSAPLSVVVLGAPREMFGGLRLALE